MNKLELWVKINKEGKIGINLYSKIRLLNFVRKQSSDIFKIIVGHQGDRKSSNALGLYFGGIIPAIIAQDKNLVHRNQIKNNPMILSDLCKEKRITSEEVDQYHKDIMLSFRPIMAYDIRTKEPSRTGEEMKKYNNYQLNEIINEILDWAEDNYEMPNTEEYKAVRDGAKKIMETDSELDYPNYEGSPTT